ncbi:hypothetical protein HG530_012261 [Fusarium avenaceum]|nr:hypothetical protein HG530_012261 [Fusarium avenaceum]
MSATESVYPQSRMMGTSFIASTESPPDVKKLRHHESRKNSSASDSGSRISELSFAAADAWRLAEISAPRARRDLRSVFPETSFTVSHESHQHRFFVLVSRCDDLGDDFCARGEKVLDVVLDLAQLYTLATELDLGIFAADEDKAPLTIGIVSDQIACLVQTSPSSGDAVCASKEEIRVVDKGRVCLFRITQVSLTNNGAFHEQFANSTNRHELVVVFRVDKPNACAGARTDTNIRLACCAGIDSTSDSTLSRTVTNNNTSVLSPNSNVSCRTGLTADTKAVE